MKHKSWFILVLVLGLLVTTRVVWAEVTLPRITTACESKMGALLSVNDGFSLLDKCRDNQRLVVLGEQAQNGRGTIGAGNVLFMGEYILTKDGKVWWNDGTHWINDVDKDIPPEISLSSIVDWAQANLIFMTTDGSIYKYIWPGNGMPSGWKNLGHP